MFLLGITNAGVRILRVTYLFKNIPNNIIGRATSVFSSINVIVRMSLIGLFSSPFFFEDDNIRWGYFIGFLLLFITRTKKHAGKLSRDGVGWKVKNILGQHKYRKFPKTRDRRFKINRKHKHKALMFHGSGAVTHPEPITFKGSNIIGDKKEE